METTPRHRCFVYEGAPSRNLGPIATALCAKLHENYRCLYLNTLPMVAGLRSYVAALGVDVESELSGGTLVLASDRDHLVDGRFDVDNLIRSLDSAVDQALNDGFAGLFATGDITWEFGPEKDFDKLVEYEWRLEDLFRARPELSGICQYHVNSLPPDVIRHGVLTHPGVFVNETLSLINPRFRHPRYARGLSEIPAT